MKKYQKQFTLTTEQKQENLEKFKKIQNKYKPYTDELLQYLVDEGMFECPASTSLNMHNCFPSGLIDHVLRVGSYTTQINKLLPEDRQQEIESIIRVVFLHSIGKVGIYEEQESKWHRENLGSYYQYVTEDKVTMKIGERSAYLSMKHGVTLEDYEYQSLINVYKDTSEDLQAKYFSDPLTIILKQGIQLAQMEEQKRQEDFNK